MSDYGNIRMAIRWFTNPTIPHKNAADIDIDLKIGYFTGIPSNKLKGKTIRNKMVKRSPASNIPALKSWCQDLSLAEEDINWEIVFKTLNCTFTNNFKLMQFQYKLLHRISTCRYMRFKMKIDRESENCYNCNVVPETLPHIFLDCPITRLFVARVTRFITERIDTNYNDDSNIFYLTCNHSNPTINFVWAVAKHYISHNFQHQIDLHWRAFRGYILRFLVGEKPHIVDSIVSALES